MLGAQREGARTLAELLGPVGVTAAQAEVLAALRDAGGPLTVREIGERLVCERGSPSRLVGTMADAGLVRREARPGDRRAVQISLTVAGERAAEGVRAAERALHGELADIVGEQDIAAAVRALRKLVAGRAAGDAIARRRAGTPVGATMPQRGG